MASLSRESSKEFHKRIKNMRNRDKPPNQTTIINDKRGNPILNSKQSIARWAEYFQKLLNLTSVTTSPVFEPRPSGHEEPNFLIAEVQSVIKNSPKNKTPGSDGINTETTQVCGQTGTKWIRRLHNKAREERTVTDDWQQGLVIPI